MTEAGRPWPPRAGGGNDGLGQPAGHLAGTRTAPVVERDPAVGRPGRRTGRRTGARAAAPQPGPGRVGPAANREEPTPPWAELHCHSSYSFLDGASSPAELVAEASRQGVQALAITDHDGMYGVAQFAQAAARRAEQTGTPLRTVFGAELSLGCVDPGGRTPGTPRHPRWYSPHTGRSPGPDGPGLAGPVRNSGPCGGTRSGGAASAGAGPGCGGLPAVVRGDQRGPAGGGREGAAGLRPWRSARMLTTGIGWY